MNALVDGRKSGAAIFRLAYDDPTEFRKRSVRQDAQRYVCSGESEDGGETVRKRLLFTLHMLMGAATSATRSIALHH